MKLQELWPLYVKWVVVWLVILPMILFRVENSWLFTSRVYGSMIVGFCFGLFVSLVDRTFFFLCHFRKR
ncbi:hypothetical protein ACQSED_14775 [Salmonella enterica]|uniref:hypothetical protein n=1 Tax=Salmonella enterica TaxID=28901 RepID=UPI003D315F44